MKDISDIITEEEVGKTLGILFRGPGDMISEAEGEITLTEDQVGKYVYEILGSFFWAQLRSIPTEEDRKAFIENTPIAELIDACKHIYDPVTRKKILKDFSFTLK